MALLINGAGVSAADPILEGLGIKLGMVPTSMNVADVVGAWIDTVSGFPGTNSVLANLTPAETVILGDISATYNDTSKELTLTSTTGLAAGDLTFLSHATITDGDYEIAAVSGSAITLVNNPFNGGGNQTAVAYQAAWALDVVAGSNGTTTSAGGQVNYLKFRADDSLTNRTDQEDSFFIRSAPAGSGLIALQGGGYTGQTLSSFTASLAILGSWANQGGVGFVELADHSTQVTNDFTWTSGGGIAERTLASAESSGLTASAGDGAKYGRILLKAASGGSAVVVGVDISFTVDTAGPTITLVARAA